MQTSFPMNMDEFRLNTNGAYFAPRNLDELFEVFLSDLLSVDRVRKAEISLFNKRRELVPVANAVNVGTIGKEEQEIRVQGWLMDSSVVHSIHKVNLPNIHFAFSIPLLQSTEMLGFLHIELDQIPTSGNSNIVDFNLLGQQLSAKIKEIMLSQEIKEAKSELQNMTANNREMLQQITSLSKELYAITAISTKINQSMEFDKSLRKSMTKVREVFKASSIVVYIKDSRTSRLELSAMDILDNAFDPGPLKRFLKKLEKDLLHDIITLGKPLVKDLREVFKEKDFEKLGEGEIRSLIGVPVNSKEADIGVLLLLYKSSGNFKQSSLRLLSGMANIMGMAVDNMNLYRETEQKKREAAFLVSSIKRFHKKLDLKKTLKSVAEEGAKLTGEQCEVYLFSTTKVPMTRAIYQEHGDGRSLKSRAFKAIHPKELKDLYEFMVSQNKSVLIRSINHTRKIGQDIKAYLQKRNLHFLMAVPLRLSGETLGLLLLGKEKGKRPFDRNDLSVAEALGSAASVAIQNARAFTSSLEMSDFLEKKITEKTSQIEQIQKRQKIGVEHRKDIIFRANRRNRFVFVNKAMETLTGHSREAFYRGDILANEIVAEEDRDRVRTAFAKILNSELPLIKDLEYRQLTRGQENRIISLTIYPERDSANRIVGVEGVGRDITEEKRLEAELTKAKELALLGEFSGDIAHQIRNPLSNILMGAKRLEKALKLDVQVQKAAGQSLKELFFLKGGRGNLAAIFGDLSNGISNLNQVVTGLLQYTKTMKPTRSFQRIDVILRETPKMFQELIEKNRIRVEEDFDPKLPPLPVDALLIGQVFQNVIHNSLEAMPDGGRLLLSARFSSNRVRHAVISISDSGVGVNPSETENVFRPFYSTKGSGVGLGLSLAYRIVEAHNGVMLVCNNPCPHLAPRPSGNIAGDCAPQAEGTTIHILLPLRNTKKTDKIVIGDKNE
ncbi:MAG: GAF domain-containing protein [Desulfobacteraceae bacterium]|nr:GAF domain-containing protein [Deltaproteobacteria bacterium]MBL6977329.1 GAF domain-containing protein [Desulfobacteraceae bacterium]